MHEYAFWQRPLFGRSGRPRRAERPDRRARADEHRGRFGRPERRLGGRYPRPSSSLSVRPAGRRSISRVRHPPGRGDNRPAVAVDRWMRFWPSAPGGSAEGRAHCPEAEAAAIELIETAIRRIGFTARPAVVDRGVPMQPLPAGFVPFGTPFCRKALPRAGLSTARLWVPACLLAWLSWLEALGGLLAFIWRAGEAANLRRVWSVHW